MNEATGRRYLTIPRTALGRWSLALAAGFFVFMFLFFQQANAPGRDRSTFFSDPINAALLVGAALSGIGGGVAALLAVGLRRERSLLLLPVVLLAAVVLLFSLGEILGGH